MKKLLFVLFALIFGLSTQVRAESSATAYEPHLRSYQVFVNAFNSGEDLPANAPVVVDVVASSSTDGSTKGAYIRGTSTTDSIWVYGVTDTAVPSNTTGRICIRGPHKVVAYNNLIGAGTLATGVIFSASNNSGRAGIYATADGTAGGQLGALMSTTATSDTGDASNTFWVLVAPQVHR